MIKPSTFQFLRDLQRNNQKAWFEDHRDAYDAALDNLTEMTGRLIEDAKQFDPAIASQTIDPRKCISRIHRDMRFQKGKPPYKPDWYILIGGDAQHGSAAGYHLRIMPAGSFAGGGLYTPDPPTLLAIRKRISGHLDQWQALVTKLERTGLAPDGITAPEALKTIPQGFDMEDPAAEYLRMKGFVANCPLTNEALMQDKAHDPIIERFKAAKPLVDFINL